MKKSLRSKDRLERWEERDTGFATPCRIWTGSIGAYRDGNGRYGTIYHAGRYQKAHRVLWEQAHGPLSADVQLHHLCGVTQCVNIAHLVALTRLEHMREHHAKLDPDRVRYIRTARKSQNTIARELGVSEWLVGLVQRGEAWADVE